MDKSEQALLIRLLSQVRSDFDRLRGHVAPISAQLLHRATNAEAEGVRGIPRPKATAVAMQGAGHRESSQRRDENGYPIFRDDPIPDAKGTPITNSAGQAFDVIMPASRSVTFSGRSEDYHMLVGLAQRAGRITAKLACLPIMNVLAGWSFSSPSDLWWALIFEAAWERKHPLLVAEKRLWLPADEPSTFIPYNLQQVNSLASSPLGLGIKIPENWLKRLPDAWVSDVDDMLAASVDTADYLLGELTSEDVGTRPASELPQDAQKPHVETQVDPISRIGALRDAATREYAASKGTFWLAAFPAELQVSRCEIEDPACGNVTDGSVALPWGSLHSLGTVEVAGQGVFRILAFSLLCRPTDEVDRFLALAADAGATFIACPPAWGQGLERPHTPASTWVAALMFLVPAPAVCVIEKPAGCRLIPQPWAASVAALRDWKDKLVVAQDSRKEHALTFDSVPHSLAAAHASLTALLDDALDVFGRTRRFPSSGNVLSAVERFVNELTLRPEWFAELNRRASLIEANCTDATPYERTRQAAIATCPSNPPESRTGLALDWWRNIMGRLQDPNTQNPVLLAEIVTVRTAIETVLADDSFALTPEAKQGLAAWKDECRKIQLAAERLEVDGCWYLYHVYTAEGTDSSERSRSAKAIMQTNPGGTHLPSLRAAADSVMAWIRERGSREPANVSSPEKPAAEGDVMTVCVRDQVFISYSHKDRRWRDDLLTHLTPYLRDGSIMAWSDQQISPGSKWFEEIRQALAKTRVAVLLVTPNFLASDFIHKHELSPLLREAESGGARILWIPVRASSYKKSPIEKYHAVIEPAKPLAQMHAERDAAWVRICEAIEKALKPD